MKPLLDAPAPLEVQPKAKSISPRRAGSLALLLVGVGFIVGYGAGSGRRAPDASLPVKKGKAPPPPQVVAPIVKGLHLSPRGDAVAFTGVYDSSRRASRFVLDLQSLQFSAQESPLGWQDYITQWTPDGNRLLFEREKIPRPVAEASAGIYDQGVQSGKLEKQPRAVSKGLAPQGEKITTGFLTPEGRLILKTRREPKALYEVNGQKTRLLDRAGGTYLQNRAVREGGRTTYYVARDVPGSSGQSALFRLGKSGARQLGPAFSDVVWMYLAEDGHRFIVCRNAPDGENWQWSLYKVGPQGLKFEKQGMVPADAISVYWSPRRDYVLGASGNNLWAIQIPSLRVTKLSARHDWNADDATWLPDGRAVLVAAGGRLFRIEVPSGQAREVWKFPASYWN